MSIRSNSRPAGYDLSPELQDILRRNGMQGHVILQGDAYHLAVQGHDSPLLTYAVTPEQLRALTDWGTNSANRKAYNTFTALVEKDFYMPRNFVHARNANGRVAMGLHGYRIGVGEPTNEARANVQARLDFALQGGGRPIGQYGRMPVRMPLPPGVHRDFWGHHHGFLGWTPRHQDGFHMRRVGGALFMQGAPIVPERPDGRMKPGELQSGGYGFYYKGQQAVTPQPTKDVLQDLQVSLPEPEVQVRPRPQEPAKPYQDVITSNVYFTNEKWREVLASHGIVVDAEAKTLTILSSASEHDFQYDLTDEELKKLTANSTKEVPVQARLDVINGIIKDDFQDQVTMDALNSKELVAMKLKPEVEQQLNEALQARQTMVADDGLMFTPELQLHEDKSVGRVDGNALYELNENKGWFREGKHGREVTVDDIRVEPVRNEQGEPVKDEKGDMKYRMTAVINGEPISHEITQRQYDKFMAIDDYHRMKLFSHIFHEVDMKTLPGHGVNIGAAILAGLAVTGEMAHGVGHVVHEINGIGHHPAPELAMPSSVATQASSSKLGCPSLLPQFYEERHGGPRGHVYFKPGVDSPQEIAARAFDAGVNAAEHGVGLGR